MADSFFGFDTSLSNLNDDDGPGEPSEDEYDALNDETFGQDSEEFDWEVEHEHLAEELERGRRHHSMDFNSQLEASLSQLVLDDTDSQTLALGSSVWRHDLPHVPPVPTLKNVCTVEELERQLRQKQQAANNQNFFQPRYPPVILQRPPGLQAPVPLPFAPQQPPTNMRDMNQPLNKMLGQGQINQHGQNNLLPNHMSQNMTQVGQNVNQFMQNANQLNQFQNNSMNQNTFGPPQNQYQNQMGQGVNLMQNQMGQMGQPNQLNQGLQMGQMGQSSSLSQSLGLNQQNTMGNMNQLNQSSNHNQNMGQMNQMGQSQVNHQMNHIGQNQLGPNMNHMGQNVNHGGQTVNQMGQNMNQMGQNVNHIGQNQMSGTQLGPNVGPHINQMGQKVNQMGQSVNQMGQNVNQMGQNMNQMGQNVSQMGHNMNQMGQNVNQMGQKQNVTQMGQNMNQIGQNVNQVGQNINQMGQNVNQMGQNVNQMGQNVNQGQNQMMPNGNQFGGGMNQFPHMMGQPRMMAPPPGIGMHRQNFNQNLGQFNQNFRGPQPMQQKLPEPVNPMIQNSQYQPIKMPNQSPNVKTNSTLTTQKKAQTSPQKVENKKTRVFNATNSKVTQVQPGLTSQNLVQIIQNTHPILQMNNQMNSSFHNASHHPMLNRNSYNSQFSNQGFQRHNGSFSNRHDMNGDDSASSDSDEYAGLMTQREKQWLINIQMLQLNTGTPYIHDFYYTVFLERQASKEKEGIKEAHKANQQNHPFYSGAVKQENHQRERHNSNRHNSTSEDTPTPRTYVPAQFENSLGKLQCGSVTAPRKIIDADVVPADTRPPSRAASRASTANPGEVPRELKRTKQLLLDIEALYLILLRLEELNDPLAISNALILKEREEKQKQLEAAQKELENEQEEDSNLFLKNIESVQRRPKQESPKSETIDKRQVVNLAVCQKPPVKNLLDEDKEELVGRMFSGLLHSDRLHQILTVRKGRSLVCRFLCRVPASHALSRALWARVLRAAPSAGRRGDSGLAALAPHYRRYLQSTTGWSAVLESCSMLAEAFDPARTPYALTTSFTLTCVCVLLERAITLVNTTDATSYERQWSKFLKTLARALKNTTLTVAKPLYPLPEQKLITHLKQLHSRATIEILQRGKSAEFADITKEDVQEQLVKHLC